MTAPTTLDIRAARTLAPAVFARPLGSRLRRMVMASAFIAAFAFGLWRMELSPTRLLAGFG